MFKYQDLLESVNYELYGREDVEWSNFWYDSANKKCDKRILMIGDSTARMVRSKFAKKISLPVDLLGTSSGLHDILFCSQVEAFFERGVKYDVAFIQLGNHSRQNDYGKPYTNDDYDRYRKDLVALVTFLKQFCNRIILETIFLCVIPLNNVASWFERITRIKLEKWDPVINNNTKRKNLVIKGVASELGLELLDINEAMINKNYMRTDHIHFEKRAIPEIVKLMYEHISVYEIDQ